MISNRIKLCQAGRGDLEGGSVAGFQSLIHDIEPRLARVGICMPGYNMGHRLLTKGLQRLRNRAR
jgi:hypothetical protein